MAENIANKAPEQPPIEPGTEAVGEPEDTSNTAQEPVSGPETEEEEELTPMQRLLKEIAEEEEEEEPEEENTYDGEEEDPPAPDPDVVKKQEEDAKRERELASEKAKAENEIALLKALREEAMQAQADQAMQARIDAELRIRLAAQSARKEADDFVASKPDFKDESFRQAVGKIMMDKRIPLQDAYKLAKYDLLESENARLPELERQISRYSAQGSPRVSGAKPTKAIMEHPTKFLRWLEDHPDYDPDSDENY